MDTVGQAAKRLEISQSSVRNYSKWFSDFFSDAAVPPKGQQRLFDDEDLKLLATIARLKRQGVDDNGIKEELSAGQLDDVANELPPEPNAIMVMQLSSTLASREGELTATKEERDRLLDDLETERQARRQSDERATAAETELKILRELTERQAPEEERPLTWWQRIFGSQS